MRELVEEIDSFAQENRVLWEPAVGLADEILQRRCKIAMALAFEIELFPNHEV